MSASDVTPEGGPALSPDNPEMAKAIFADGKEREAERKEELTDAERDKQKIFDALESRTCRVRVFGTPIECSILTGGEEDWIDSLTEEFIEYRDVDDEDAEEEMSEEEFARYQELKTRITDTLIEHAVEGTYDREFWERIPFSEREKAVARLSKGGDEGERAGN